MFLFQNTSTDMQVRCDTGTNPAQQRTSSTELALKNHYTISLSSHTHRVTIVDFRKVGQKGLRNEDKVGKNVFKQEDKVRQKSLKKSTKLSKIL